MENKPKTLLPFYILVSYITLQSVWWTYLLSSLSGEIAVQRESVLRTQYTDDIQFQTALDELNSKQLHRVIMIGTEGTVFLSLLIFGIIRVKRSFEKENQMIKQQKNFMLSVTHELKTPLAAVKLNLQTLMKRELSREQQKFIIENAVGDADRLNLMIENVLIASRMEAAEVKFYPEKVNLSFFVEDFFTKSVHKERVQLNVEQDVWVNADKHYGLPSLISNLVENALKYSEKRVEIRVTQENGVAVLSVLDNGKGIPDTEKEKIFEKFYRIGNEDTRKTKGTGLGLFIVKYIADKCKMKIVIKDNIPEGSIFSVHFHYQ